MKITLRIRGGTQNWRHRLTKKEYRAANKREGMASDTLGPFTINVT